MSLETALMATYGIGLAEEWQQTPLMRRHAIRRLQPELAHALDRATLELQKARSGRPDLGPVGRFFDRLSHPDDRRT